MSSKKIIGVIQASGHYSFSTCSSYKPPRQARSASPSQAGTSRQTSHQGRAGEVRQQARPPGTGIRRPALQRLPVPPPKPFMPMYPRVGSSAPARSIAARIRPTWPGAWSCCRWFLMPQRKPQTVLLLGGTSEIRLAICERYLPGRRPASCWPALTRREDARPLR